MKKREIKKEILDSIIGWKNQNLTTPAKLKTKELLWLILQKLDNLERTIEVIQEKVAPDEDDE